MPAELKSQLMGRTLVLTISNPEQRNALGPEIYAAGTEALRRCEQQAEVGSVIITGEGGNFCAGGNLHRLLANREQAPEVQGQSIDALNAWLTMLRHFPKPVVCAVEGACAGAGFSLALSCDLLVAARDAVFVMAYSNVGLSPDGGASWSLAQALPRAMLSEILLLGGRMGADRLAQLGLVNQAVEPGQALIEALRLCEAINNRAPNVMASIKRLINSATTSNWPDQLAREREQFVANLHHANGLEGIEAFLGKRPARYQ
jgi:enoyl-CoA hydratase/carnithine racemase